VTARQEDFVFAEHVLRRGFATEEQVQECLDLLARVRGEMQINETLEGILLKKGYLAEAQATVIGDAINPEEAGRSRNQIEGYRLLSRLGSGAMGSVYKALHQKLDILVAMKVLRVELSKSKTQVERLKREAQLAARLNHPNIVRSLDVGESNGFHYFAMEFVDGGTARGLIREGRMKERHALRIIASVARALDHAHSHGVIHRDVKPANIMISKAGVVKLGDFGLARGQGPSELTLEHAAIGTPQYLAPEQAAGAANAGPRSDLFSLGATLYHLVTGQPPFSGENLAEIFTKVIQGRFEPPETVVDDLSVDTLYLIHRLMRPNPRDRYQTAAELVADLERLDRGERIAPADFKGDYRAFLDRRRRKRFAIGAAAVLVICASAWFTASTISSRNAERDALAACVALNGKGEDELERLGSLADLRAKQTELSTARASIPCSADLMPDLDKRIDTLATDVERLDGAGKLLVGLGADANFQDVGRRLDAIQKPYLDGARVCREILDRDVKHRSLEAARARYHAVYNAEYTKAEQAIEALQGLARDLRERFLPVDEEWAPKVGPHAREVASLKRAFAAAESKHGQSFENALQMLNFDSAARQLELMHRAQGEARSSATRQQLPERFLRLFPPVDTKRRERILDAERAEWKALKLDIDAEQSAERPDRALKHLREFLQGAQWYRKEAEVLERTLVARVEKLQDDQLRAIDALERNFKRALGERQYGAVVDLVATKKGERAWFGDAEVRFSTLEVRANRIEGLVNSFLPRLRAMKAVPITAITKQARPATVKGEAFSRAKGEGRDRYVVRVNKKDHVFRLSVFDYKTLAHIFQFDRDTKRGHDAQSGYFHVAEAYRESNLYRRAELLDRAHDDLFAAGDSWIVGVDTEIEQVQLAIRDAETRAQKLLDSYDDARKSNEHGNALTAAERLLQEFAWTWKVKDRVGHLERDIKNLASLVGKARQRFDSAIPPQFFTFLDERGGRVEIRYTGAEWHPLEGAVPPRVEDRAAWLETREREYYKRSWKAAGGKPGTFETYYRRALHQLLDWRGKVDVRMPGANEPLDPPGYVFKVQDPRAPQRFWWHSEWKKLDESVILLTNHFRPDADWSIEFTVDWSKVAWQVKSLVGAGPAITEYREEAKVPVYFAVAAGKLQAAIGYLPKSAGGVAGTRIFFAESMCPENGHNDQLGDFHWHMANRPDRKKIKNTFSAWIDPGRYERDSAYRVRLARVANEVHFFFAPIGRWEKQKSGFDSLSIKEWKKGGRFKNAVHVWYKPRIPGELSKAVKWNQKLPAFRFPAFRFFGRVRFTLRDVRLIGELKVKPPKAQ